MIERDLILDVSYALLFAEICDCFNQSTQSVHTITKYVIIDYFMQDKLGLQNNCALK